MARWGSIQAGLDLDTSRYFAYQAANAWGAVGVGDTCEYVPGDVNGNGVASGSDITWLQGYFKGTQGPPVDSCRLPYLIGTREWFYVAADYNGDCVVSGADVSYGVSYFKGFKPRIKWCPHSSPIALTFSLKTGPFETSI